MAVCLTTSSLWIILAVGTTDQRADCVYWQPGHEPRVGGRCGGLPTHHPGHGFLEDRPDHPASQLPAGGSEVKGGRQASTPYPLVARRPHSRNPCPSVTAEALPRYVRQIDINLAFLDMGRSPYEPDLSVFECGRSRNTGCSSMLSNPYERPRSGQPLVTTTTDYRLSTCDAMHYFLHAELSQFHRRKAQRTHANIRPWHHTRARWYDIELTDPVLQSGIW